MLYIITYVNILFCNLLVLVVVLFIDQFEDQFEKRSKQKKERIAKNEYQRLRNLARNKKGKVKGTYSLVLGDIEIYSLVLVTKDLSQYTGIYVVIIHMTVVFGCFVSLLQHMHTIMRSYVLSKGIKNPTCYS